MHWQDIVFSIGSWIFAIALVPSILSKTDKPALSSSLLTASLLTLYVPTYASLHLVVSAISGGVIATAWWSLAYQKWKLNKEKNSGPGTHAS